MAFNRLRRFLTLLSPLACLAKPSSLLDEISKFNPTGLGPFFGNIPNLARSPDDIFYLLEMALPDALQREIEFWIALLSIQLPAFDTVNLAAEAAGREMSRVARYLLLRVIRRRHLYHDPYAQLRRVREVSFRYGWFDIALSSQEIIAENRPFDANEVGILGDLLATCDRPSDASKAFLRCLEIDPDERRATRALSASSADNRSRQTVRHFLH